MAGVVMFLVALFSTVFCTAVNCYTWRIAYPLWGYTGTRFSAVHREYLRRLGPVITGPHVVMFFASLGLLWRRPGFMSVAQAGWVFGLDAAVVLISAGVAGPVHSRFEHEGLDGAGLRRLVRVSAWRSGLMLAACGVLGWTLLTAPGWQ